VLLRSDHNTHSLTAGDRYIKLAFEARNGGNDNGQGNRGRSRGELRVTAPNLPAQATPGIYMLFVVDNDGVPSAGRQVRIRPENRGPETKFR
jgi:Domain of unknown function (DUF1929)